MAPFPIEQVEKSSGPDQGGPANATRSPRGRPCWRYVWKERAIEIMERDANRRAVALLVERLMKHEEISFDVVEACIAQVDGGPEASSWRQQFCLFRCC